MAEAGLCEEFPVMTARVYSYLENTQILSTPTAQGSPAYQYESPECRKRFYRHVSEGGWPFSTSAHGWPISDCTAEGEAIVRDDVDVLDDDDDDDDDGIRY